MIFSCGETWEAKKARLEQWHDYFILWPRTIGEENGRYKCVWLQTVERKGHYYGVCCWPGDFNYVFRLKDDKE